MFLVSTVETLQSRGGGEQSMPCQYVWRGAPRCWLRQRSHLNKLATSSTMSTEPDPTFTPCLLLNKALAATHILTKLIQKKKKTEDTITSAWNQQHTFTNVVHHLSLSLQLPWAAPLLHSSIITITQLISKLKERRSPRVVVWKSHQQIQNHTMALRP